MRTTLSCMSSTRISLICRIISVVSINLFSTFLNHCSPDPLQDGARDVIKPIVFFNRRRTANTCAANSSRTRWHLLWFPIAEHQDTTNSDVCKFQNRISTNFDVGEFQNGTPARLLSHWGCNVGRWCGVDGGGPPGSNFNPGPKSSHFA